MQSLNWPLMPNVITWRDKLRMIKFLITSDRLTNGPRVREFEQAWNKWLGSKYSLMVSSGSTANFLLLASVKELYQLGSGSKVLLPACTWVTNVSPVIQLGLQPIFCDINLHDFSFDHEHLESIKAAHPDISLIFVTHLLGYAANNALLRNMWPDALILDDVCESHGTEHLNGAKVGSDSLGATFSFYFGHHMTTIEGGMISTNNSDLFELMRIKRSHGLAREGLRHKEYASWYPDIDSQFLFITDGYNFRSSEINAVLGLSQLPRLDSMIEQRRYNADTFVELINRRRDLFHILSYRQGDSSYCLPFICRTPEIKDSLKARLRDACIESRPIVGGNLLRQPFLQNYTYGAPLPRDYANADILNSNGLYIGNNHTLRARDVLKLEDLIRDL